MFHCNYLEKALSIIEHVAILRQATMPLIFNSDELL